MKTFTLLLKHRFLFVGQPDKIKLDEFGLSVIKIKAQTGHYTDIKHEIFPNPSSCVNQSESSCDRALSYCALNNALFRDFNEKFSACMDALRSHVPIPAQYTNFGFDLYQKPATSHNGHDDHLSTAYQLKMKIRDDLGNDWLKTLRHVCGGDRIKMTASLELERKVDNGVLNAILVSSEMPILEVDDKNFCIGEKLFANQVRELEALLDCRAPWAVLSGQVSVWLDVDDDSFVFTRQGSGGARHLSGLAIFNMEILENEFDVDVEIVPGGGGDPVRCHSQYLSGRSSVFEAMVDQPMMDGEIKRIHMPDATNICVQRMLRYLYTDNLTVDEDAGDSTLLIQLWEVAKDFAIMDLEKEIKCYLEAKDLSTFQLGFALKLFCFTRKLVNDDCGKRLKKKALLALKGKLAYDELQSAPEYAQLFQNDPESAMDLCIGAFSV